MHLPDAHSKLKSGVNNQSNNKRSSIGNTSTHLGASLAGNGLSSQGLLSSGKDYFNSTAPINMNKYNSNGASG